MNDSPNSFKLRMGLFISSGIAVAFPYLVSCFYANPQELMSYDFGLLLGGGIVYIVGAIIYGFRLPEKQLPGKFDILGSSH